MVHPVEPPQELRARPTEPIVDDEVRDFAEDELDDEVDEDEEFIDEEEDQELPPARPVAFASLEGSLVSRRLRRHYGPTALCPRR